MIDNGDGTFTFTDLEWAQHVDELSQRNAQVETLRTNISNNLIDISRITERNVFLDNKNKIYEDEINQLIKLNTDYLFQIDSLQVQIATLESGINVPPVAIISTNPTQAINTLVVLDGTLSTTSYASIVNYQWTMISKPATSSSVIINSTLATANFTADVAGNYVIGLVVNNGVLSSALQSITIEAMYINYAPVADAGTQTSKLTGATVQLDGSGSSDPNGDTLFYSWVITTKPTGSTATLSNASIVNPTFVADVAGSYTITLTVSDGQLLATDTVSFIAAAANVAPIANAGSGPISPIVGTLITLNGSASSDPNGDPLTYAWTLPTRPGGSAATLSNASTVTPSFTPDVAGTYIASLVVSDGSLSSTASTVSMVVAAVNTAPVANIATVSNAIVGTPINLSAAGSTDAESDPLTYLWAIITRPTGSTNNLSSTTTVNPTFTPDVAGSYTLRLIVNDGKVDSAAVTQTFVAATANVAPIANAGTGSSPLVGATVYLFGGGSYDPNGDAITYLWSITTKPNGSTATLSSTTAINPTFVGDIAGTYIMSLVVNDGIVNSTASTVTYTVRQPNRAPTAIASTTQSNVINGTVISLNGSSSYDPDGDAITYLWSLTKPGGSAATLSSTTVANPTFTADITGTYTASLVVNDGQLNSSAVNVVITSTSLIIPFFTDNFETGNINKLLNGLTFWTDNSSGFQQPSATQKSTITVGQDSDGGYSVRALYAGTTNIDEDARPELRFRFNGGQYPELWVSFDLHIPSNYYHRIPPGTGNNKFFIIDDNAGIQYMDLEVWPLGTDGSDRISFNSKYNNIPQGHVFPPQNLTLGAPSDRDRWHQYVIHLKLSTSSTANNGMIQVWKNGSLTMNFQNLPHYTPSANHFERGYIFGASNSGFTLDTILKLDNITWSIQELPKIWTAHT